jgi:alpha/beta superfamily hydrolase
MASTQFTTELTTADGHALAADLTIPAEATAGVVVCHPHPRFGGNRFNPVVDAGFTRADHAGFAAIRFDFRADHGGGVTETQDVVAALDVLACHITGPLAVVGYSFGAAVAIATADDRIAALVAIAPPLAMMPAATPQAPTLVLTPRHDQFTDVETVIEAVDGWPDATVEVVESADHFLAGHTTAVADRAIVHLTRYLV